MPDFPPPDWRLEIERDMGRIRERVQVLESLERVAPKIADLERVIQTLLGYGDKMDDIRLQTLRDAVGFLLEKYAQRDLIGRIIEEWKELFDMENPSYWDVKRMLLETYRKQQERRMEKMISAVLRTVVGTVGGAVALYLLGRYLGVSLK